MVREKENDFYMNKYSLLILLPFFLCLGMTAFGQPGKPAAHTSSPANKSVTALNDRKDIFGVNGSFIQNIGQFGTTFKGAEKLGTILYGYEGLGAPVLFTSSGMIYLQRKMKNLSPREMERRERQEKRGKEKGEESSIFEEQAITMEWLNANPDPVIEATEPEAAYHVYAMLTQKATGYKKITYKNLYPGIDLVCSFGTKNMTGFEYSLVVRPGAALSAVQMRLGGDIKSVRNDKDGKLIIQSGIDGLMQSAPVCFYSDQSMNAKQLPVIFNVSRNTVGFQLTSSYDVTKEIVIDPYVTGITTLTGTNNGIAKDIDFDYDGNVYVSGGGDNSAQRLAKFGPDGTLLWTFSGTLTSPVWSFGGAFGGWVVDKGSGNIYLGQGLAGNGFSVIRLNASGAYDNYISTPNTNFGENWKMIWSCNGGSPKILVAGGGGSASNELALLAPPAVVPATSNLSGLSGGHNDISDIVIDPVTNDMFTIYSIPITSTPNDNIIYKHPPPYNSSLIAWQRPAGFMSLNEPRNRPYLSGLDNSSNTLAVNSFYLFYWDGRNLMAMNKSTGATVGTPISLSSGVLMSGGIFADECNNVFVGTTTGSIKVLKFNGSGFDDAAAADISIAGFPTSAVFDMVHDNARELLYVSGNGFVASVDISSYCPSTLYSVNVATNCIAGSCTATVSPVPPSGTTVTYVLYNGTTQLGSNTTGAFTGLITGVNYTIKAFLNQACGGTQAVANFALTTAPLLVITNTQAVCVPEGRADITVPAVTAGSVAGITLSYWMDAQATQPFTTPASAPAGTYYIKAVTVGSACPDLKPVVVPALPIPVAIASAGPEICFGKDGQLTGSGGGTYSWSPATYLDDPTSASPRVIRPGAGSHIYHLVVTDANGCHSQSDATATIVVTPPPKIKIPADTVVAIHQPLQLDVIDVNNSGLVNFTWLPATGLNNPFIKNPIAILDADIQYQVTATTANNCQVMGYVKVKVYQGPEIYVPTAFTPSSDGLNDVLKAIPVGIKEFHYFNIYNRWGQLIFTTSNPAVGWDGKVQGVPQGPNSFVWTVEGVDYFGNLIRKKGMVTLVR